MQHNLYYVAFLIVVTKGYRFKMTDITKKQIKSKKRVINHGEVFTNEREVKAMCDLVSHECERIDSRFLEPACGDGNFLSEILHRKLSTVKKNYKRNPYDFERYSVLAVTTIYGVDIMQDNVEECRARMYKIWEKEYRAVCKKECNHETKAAIRYILTQNILCGNALTLMCVDKNCHDTDVPIIFPEWSLIMGNRLKRRDFRFDVLLKANEKPKKTNRKAPYEHEELLQYLEVHPHTGEYIPKPIKEYVPIHYKKIAPIIKQLKDVTTQLQMNI